MKMLFVDFDETLFNHYAYLEWADSFLAKRGHTARLGEYLDVVEDFHEDKGEKLRLYDHDGHMKAVTDKNWSYISGELEKELRENGRDFCYADAHEFLQNAAKSGRDVRILTYGHGEYQHFKIRICPVLRELHIPVHIVHEPKRIFITREFGKNEGALIDDKYPLKLPENWIHILIDRKNSVRTVNEDNVLKIDSLGGRLGGIIDEA